MAVRVEVERLRRRALRRPRVEGSPPVAARLEHCGFRLYELSLVLEIEGEERCLDLRSIVLTRGRAEVDVAELLSRSAAPTTVSPWANDEEVAIGPIVLLELAIDHDRPVEIFLVPPSRDVERGHRDAGEIRTHRLSLPELVVVRMRRGVGPARQLLVLEHLRLDVRQRPDVEIPVVGVRALVDRLLRRVDRLGRPLHHERPLALVATANVLEDEDVAVLREILVRDGDLLAGLGDAVGRAFEEKGERLARILRAEDL